MMQIIQLILVLGAIGLNLLVYSEVVLAYLECNAGDCGAVHMITFFSTPVLLVISLLTLILASKKLSSETATPEQIKSAHLIKTLSIISLFAVILPLFVLPFILMAIEFILKLI